MFEVTCYVLSGFSRGRMIVRRADDVGLFEMQKKALQEYRMLGLETKDAGRKLIEHQKLRKQRMWVGNPL